MASEAQITNAEIVELGRARFLVAMLSGGAAGLMFAAMLVMAIQQNYVSTQERETRMARTVAGLEKPVNLVVLFPFTVPDMDI